MLSQLPGIETAAALLLLDVVALGLVVRHAFRYPGARRAPLLSWLALGLSYSSLLAAALFWSLVTGRIAQVPFIDQHMEIVDWALDGTWFDDLVMLPWTALVLLQGGVLTAMLGRGRLGQRTALLLSTVCLAAATVLLYSLAFLRSAAPQG